MCKERQQNAVWNEADLEADGIYFSMIGTSKYPVVVLENYSV